MCKIENNIEIKLGFLNCFFYICKKYVNMKKIFFVLFLCIVFTNSFSQESFVQMNNDLLCSFVKVDKNMPINYVVGDELLGYKYMIKTLPHGYVCDNDRYPVLTYYKKIEGEYIGGMVVDQISKDTMEIIGFSFNIVKDIVNNKELGVFYINAKDKKGKNITYSIRTNFGKILEEGEDYVLFSEYKSIFKIEKNEKYKFNRKIEVRS